MAGLMAGLMAVGVTTWVLAAAVVVGGSGGGGLLGSTPAPVTAVQPASAPEEVTVRPSDTRQRRPPVPGEPVRLFEAPAHDYGPGHRGVDLAADEGDTVSAPAAGVVTFAGPVAGRGVVVVEHDGGTLTSLEPVEGLVPVGTTVTGGQAVAVLQSGNEHAGCPTTRTPRCLHWGVRVDGRYVDPWWWLGLTSEVRLLPLSGP